MSSNVRLGPVKLALGGLGVLGVFLVLLAFYAVSALFWGWAFMLIHGAVVGKGMGPGYWTEPWGYGHSVAPWGMIAPFVLG
jgi:hypothetical protein